MGMDQEQITGLLMTNSNILSDILKKTFLIQSRALSELVVTMDTRVFAQSIEILKESRLIFTTGVGKSAHIAGKIAETFTSIGSPAIFLHAEQILHGGIGLFQEDTCLLLVSKSGATQNLLDIIEALCYIPVKKILITSRANSPLAQFVDVSLLFQCDECCGTNFVPTTSTTLSLAIGDALAMVLMKENKFTVEEFARSHPGGSLGELTFDSIGRVEFPYGTRKT